MLGYTNMKSISQEYTTMQSNLSAKLFRAQDALNRAEIPINFKTLSSALGTTKYKLKKLLKKLDFLIINKRIFEIKKIRFISPSTKDFSLLFSHLTVHMGGPPSAVKCENNQETKGKNEELLDSFFVQRGLPILFRENIKICKQFTGIDLASIAILHALNKHNYFHGTLSHSSRMRYAFAIVKIIILVIRSERVHHHNLHLEYLRCHDKKYNFTKLFERKGNYVVGLKSSKTYLTEYMESVIMPTAVALLSEIPLAKTKAHPTDIVANRAVFGALKIRDMFFLLTHLKGLNSSGSFLFKYCEIDIQLSRKYNIFTSICLKSRRELGYFEYDIDACLQSIVFNFLDKNEYPMHKILVQDKKRLRHHIAKRLNKSYDEVKTILTSLDNGKAHHRLRVKSRVLNRYAKESVAMVDSFLEMIMQMNLDLIIRAKLFAKHEFKKSISESGLLKFEPIENKWNKYSLFFFVWTQIERAIREEMVKSFKNKFDVREVHDAIWSKELVSKKNMERQVFDSLGLKISIS